MSEREQSLLEQQPERIQEKIREITDRIYPGGQPPDEDKEPPKMTQSQSSGRRGPLSGKGRL